MSNTTLPPEVEDEVSRLHDAACYGGVDDEGRPGPCDFVCCYHREGLRTAALIGLSAGRVQGLSKAADLAQERAHKHEGAAIRCDESDVDLTQEAYLHRKFGEVARDVERDIRKLATEDKP